MLGLGLSLWSVALGASWTPAALFGAGQAGHWAEYNPGLGRVFQDAAGTTPATLPDQPVGLAKRLVGSVDASQAVALSRPTLARWPKGGRRNLLLTTDTGSLWSQLQVGLTASDGVMRVTPTTANTAHRIKTTVVSRPGSWVTSFELKANGINFVWFVGDILSAPRCSLNLLFGAVSDARWNSEPLGDGWFRFWTASANASTGSNDGVNFFAALGMSNTADPVFVGDGVSSFLLRNPQIELGTVRTPYQNVITQNDITEVGKPDIWHLWDDGGDSLNAAPLPAGTYGLAWVDALGGATVTSVTSDGTTPINLLRTERQAEVILRQGAFTATEEAQIRSYWSGRYAA